MDSRALRNVTILGGLLCLFFIFSPAVADQEMEQETGISFMPRFWLSTIDPLTGAVAKKESYFLPMYGGTLSIRPSWTTKYQFLLTGMWGGGEGEINWPTQSLNTVVETGFGPVPANFYTSPASGKAEVERFDLELLVRRLFPDKWFSLFFGPRIATWKETTAGKAGYNLLVGPIPPLNITVSQEGNYDIAIDLDSNLYAFELGLGTVAEMSESGRHLLFSNFIFGLAYTDWKAHSQVYQNGVLDPSLSDLVGIPGGQLAGHHMGGTLDANMGYQYSGSHLGINIRYRIFMISEENALEQTQFTTLHGPEVGLVIRF